MDSRQVQLWLFLYPAPLTTSQSPTQFCCYTEKCVFLFSAPLLSLRDESWGEAVNICLQISLFYLCRACWPRGELCLSGKHSQSSPSVCLSESNSGDVLICGEQIGFFSILMEPHGPGDCFLSKHIMVFMFLLARRRPLESQLHNLSCSFNKDGYFCCLL